jgi:predicted nucleic acid-binding protein
VSLQSLEQALPGGERILLDSSTLIAYLNGGEPATPVAVHIIERFVRPGRNHAIISMLSIVEILVRPLRAGAPGGQHALTFLTRTPHFQLADVDIWIAHRAAVVRAQHNMRTPDALVSATGLTHQVGHLVTNDDRWKRLQGVNTDICYLEDHLPFP